MPVVKFFACLDLDQIGLFLDGHELAVNNIPEKKKAPFLFPVKRNGIFFLKTVIFFKYL